MAAMAGKSANFLATAAGMMAIMLGAGGAAADNAERIEGPLAVAGAVAGDLARLADGRTVRLVAHIERADGVWLQGALLERGLAQVQTRPGETARADEMLAIERKARAARRGLWAEPAFMAQDPTALAASAGRFRIVRGRVLRVAPTERYVYLNFGADWRSDFTLRIAPDLADSLAGSGLDLAGLAGRMVEVRGVVLDAAGPLIELSHPEQIQILP
jgi:micrococcal nuclease